MFGARELFECQLTIQLAFRSSFCFVLLFSSSIFFHSRFHFISRVCARLLVSLAVSSLPAELGALLAHKLANEVRQQAAEHQTRIEHTRRRERGGEKRAAAAKVVLPRKAPPVLLPERVERLCGAPEREQRQKESGKRAHAASQRNGGEQRDHVQRQQRLQPPLAPVNLLCRNWGVVVGNEVAVKRLWVTYHQLKTTRLHARRVSG